MNMREELKAFIDNEVSEQDRTRILKEIQNNPELQAEVIELRQMSRMIKEEAWQPQPVGLERTLGALQTAKRDSKPWWMRPAAILATAGACGVLAMIMFPVFAQSKAASKKSSEKSMARQRQLAFEMEQADGASATAAAPMGAFKSKGLSGRSKSQENMPTEEPYLLQDQDRNARAGDVAKTEASAPSATFASPTQRFEIKTANLALEVVEVSKAQQESEAIAKAVGGRVQSSQKSDDEGILASAELTFRVPVQNFETAVNRLRKLGRVLNDSLTGDDVTAQVVDTEARLKVMKAEEDQYVELLKATKKIGEVLSVKERLSQVRQEIESLDANRKALRSQAAESTIHLSLTEKPSEDKPRQDPEWSEDAWTRAVANLGAVGRFLGRVAVNLFVFSPIWLPVGLGWWWVAKRRRY